MVSKPENGRNIDSTTLNHTDFNDDLLNPILNDLLREISEVKDILLNHELSTSRAFEGIKDEIKSIKNLCKVRSDAVESKVEEINDSMVTLKNELSNVSSSVNKKLQSISDQIGANKTNLRHTKQQKMYNELKQYSVSIKTERNRTKKKNNNTREEYLK